MELVDIYALLNLTLVFLAGLCIAYCFLDLLWRLWTLPYADLPGPRSYPFVGNALQFETDPHKVALQFKGWMEKYGTPHVVWFGPIPVVLCGTPEYAEALLSSQTTIEKSIMYSYLTDWLGDGLLLSSGDKWRSRRRFLTPAFHFGALSNYRDMIDRKAKILVTKLDIFAKEQRVFDIQTPVGLCTLDIICEAAMGVNCEAQKAYSSEYVKSVLTLSSIIQQRSKMPHLWPNFVFRLTEMGRRFYKLLDQVHSYSRQVILKRMEAKSSAKSLSDSETTSRTFLDILLDMHANGDIETDGVQEEVDTFMFEGHDTTSSGISWTLYLLGRHQDIQEKLCQEIDDLTEGGKRRIVDVVLDMKYLESVIRESMRLHAPVPLIIRNISNELLIEDRSIPKGAQLGLVIHALHRDGNTWQSPEEFAPERFFSKGVERWHPFQYVPFSAGPRNCIGQRFAMLEQKIVIANVLRNFKITSLQRPEDVQGCGELISRSNNGLMLEICRRSVDETGS